MKKGLVICAAFVTLGFAITTMLSGCHRGEGQSESQSEIDTSNVVWRGLDDIELSIGDPQPDLITGVSAVTELGKELTFKIDDEASDIVDTNVQGAFTIYYIAYDGESAIGEDRNGEATRTVNVTRGTFIDNADFSSSSTAGWSGNPNGNSAMTWEIDANIGALIVNIAKSGDEYWQNQVEFNGLQVKKDVTYEIIITAKSETPRNIGASLEVPSLGYRCIDKVSINSVGYTMSDEYADYHFYYTAQENYTGVKFGIILGRFNELDETENVVYIDKVSIRPMAKLANSTGVVFSGKSVEEVSTFAQYQALPPITATDANGNPLTLIKEGAVQGVEFNDILGKATFGEMYKYIDSEDNLSYFRRQIQYIAPHPEREHEYDTLDGEFEYGLKFWTPEENNIAEITDLGDGTIKITSVKTPPSGEPDWRVQVQQNNVAGAKLTADHSYKMVVKAKINNINVKTLRLEFCAGAGNPNAKTDMVFDAPDTYQTFESATYTPTADVSGGAFRVGLLLGEYNQAYELTVDSIQIVEVTP